VRQFSDVKGFGFIGQDDGRADLFVHYSRIKGSGYRSLRTGQMVEFAIVDGPKGLIADQVEVVD
jgi:CspA family cold shock protein